MLDLLAGAGVPCARTDQRGDVAITLGDQGLEVRTDGRLSWSAPRRPLPPAGDRFSVCSSSP